MTHISRRSDPSTPAETYLVADDVRTTTSLLLEGLREGDRAAMNALVTILYNELCEFTHRQRERWRRDRTLGKTALIPEAYLKLSGQEDVGPESLHTVRRDWSYAQAWLNRGLEVTV